MFLNVGIWFCVCLCPHRSGSNCSSTFLKCLSADHLIGAVSTYIDLKKRTAKREEEEKSGRGTAKLDGYSARGART